jgi:DNA-binding transcriptional MerR regulator
MIKPTGHQQNHQQSESSNQQSLSGAGASQASRDAHADDELTLGKTPEMAYALGDYSFEENVVSNSTATSDAILDASTALGSDIHAEELQMMGAALPDARIDAGEELIESLRSIPEKMAFKIGEAAEMVGVKQYVLRYWESEFDMLRPRKSKNNQRVYSRRDVETAMMIKKLLYTDRFSIEGARSALRQLKSHVKEERNIKAIAQSQESAVSRLRGLVADIKRLREMF